MTKSLKLVVNNGPLKRKKGTKRHSTPRPVTIHYPWGYTGHCRSVKNAIIAAQRHLLNGRAKRVNIEVDGFIVADIQLVGNRAAVWWQKGWLNFDVEE